MAKLVSLPEIIQNIYVKLEESSQGESGTGGNCSSNITIDTSTNTGTLNVSDGSVLSTQVLNVENTPKAGRITLTDKDSNSISFDAVTLTNLESNYYDKTTIDNKLSGLVLDSYDDTELKNRVITLENTYEETVERVNSNESYKSTLEISYNLGQEGSLDYEDYNNRKYLFKNVYGSISFLENRIPGESTSSFTISTNLTPPAGVTFSSINTEIPTKAYVDTEINSIKSQLQTISSQGYDDTDIKSRLVTLENKVDNDTIYDDTDIKSRLEALENKVSNMVTYADIAPLLFNIDVTENSDINQLLATKIKGSPTTILTVDDINFVEDNRTETTTEITIHYTATVSPKITFKDGSTSNITINFTKTTKEKKESKYVYDRLMNGVKIQRTNPNVPAYVDTGLTKNGNYIFEVDGYTTNKQVSVLIGSYDSNTDRTSARILGTSNKLQSMWSANNEITNAETGIDFNSPFSYQQKANHIFIYQSGILDVDKTFTNQNTSQTTNTPIYLFNESTTGNYDHGVLIDAGIAEFVNSYNYIKFFVPYKDTRTNEIVLIDTASYKDSELDNNLKIGNISEENIYRPTNGILVEA